MGSTWITALLLAATTAPAAPAGFVTRQGSKLLLDGREYRAVGVNIPHLHQAYLGTWFHLGQIYQTPAKARQSMVEALDDCARSGLAFVRFFADPGYPRDRAMLYDKDRAAYWRGLDELLALCRERHLKLIPSLGTIPGPFTVYGEKGRAILDPGSKTYDAVHTYLREFVGRYRDEPTILMWELVNEAMLKADVEMNGRKLLPRGVYPPGVAVREEGELGDSLNWADLLALYREQAAFIKSLDPNHLVTSGDAAVRPECTSRRVTFPRFKFRPDTWSEWVANNLASQPAPLDVYSFHFYGQATVAKPGVPWAGQTALGWMTGLVRAVEAHHAPVFVGELGAAPNNKADPTGSWICAFIDAAERENIALMALWDWYFPWQPEFTMDSATYPEVVQRAAAFNRRHAVATDAAAR